MRGLSLRRDAFLQNRKEKDCTTYKIALLLLCVSKPNYKLTKMILWVSLIIGLLVVIPGNYASSSVSHPKGCFFNIKLEDLPKSNGEDATRGFINNFRSEFKDCVMIFHPAWRKRLHLSFDQFDALSEEVDSCVSSYTKIFSIDDSGERNKLAHYCNSLPTKRLIVFDTVDKVELVIFHSNIDLTYEYVSSHEEINEDFEEDINNESFIPPSETIITFKDPPSKAPKCRYPEDKDCVHLHKELFWSSKRTSESQNNGTRDYEEFYEENASPGTESLFSAGIKTECERQMKKVCKLSRFCGEGDGILCNETMYLCIDPTQTCNGVNDCIGSDSSDEFRCFFPYMSNSLFGVIGIFVTCLTTLCSVNHKTSLRKNNMVRYNGDVLKRKDIIRAKKNNVVERETSNEILNKTGTSSNNGKSVTLNVSALNLNNNNNNNVSKKSTPPRVEISEAEPEVKKRVVIENKEPSSSPPLPRGGSVVKKSEESALGVTINSIMKNSSNIHLKNEPDAIPLYLDNDDDIHVEFKENEAEEECVAHSVGYGYRFEYRDG